MFLPSTQSSPEGYVPGPCPEAHLLSDGRNAARQLHSTHDASRGGNEMEEAIVLVESAPNFSRLHAGRSCVEVGAADVFS